jgi:hypothetical protein
MNQHYNRSVIQNDKILPQGNNNTECYRGV